MPVYGSRMLFKPNRKPNLTKYMVWTDSVHLTNFACFIHGPFNFDSHSDVISAKQFAALRHWEFLLTSCIALIIVPPTISTLTATKPNVCSLILFACNYTSSVILVLIIVIFPAIAPVLSLLLSSTLAPVLFLVYYL